MEKQIYNEIFKKKCAICGDIVMVDVFGQGECKKCGWFNNIMGEENKNKVIYPNLVSLNKAKWLFKNSLPFEPNLDEFVDGLFFYSEMQFKYNGKYYGVIITNSNKTNEAIELFESGTEISQVFNSKEEFLNNAKIGNEFLKDIWDKTTARTWLQ